MRNIIRDLFESTGFSLVKTDVGDLFHMDGKSKTNYWGVVRTDNVSGFLDTQSDIFNEFSAVSSDPALSKNLSLLLLIDTNNPLILSNLKRIVMSIEEDSFFFKKQVLYYSVHELELLKAELGQQSILSFLQKRLVDYSEFQEYKKKPHAETWRSLAYRIAIKLSILSISPEDNTDLGSLDAKKNKKINHRQNADELVDLEYRFFERMPLDIPSIKEISPDELLGMLTTKNKVDQ